MERKRAQERWQKKGAKGGEEPIQFTTLLQGTPTPSRSSMQKKPDIVSSVERDLRDLERGRGKREGGRGKEKF